MGILVKAIQRINPRNKNAAKKWFAVQNSAGFSE